MKKVLFLSAVMLSAATVCADAIIDDAYYAMDKIPMELTATLQLGKDIEFKLAENTSTGYAWTASYDPRLARVSIEHETSNKMPGAPGYADIEIKALTLESFVVTLNYARPFDKNVAPQKSVTCTINVVQPGQQIPAAALTSAVATITVPPNTVLITDDAYFRLSKVPAALQASIMVGKDVDFELQEHPEKGLFWSVGQYDAGLCQIKIEHDAADSFFESSKAEIEIKALAAGTTYIDFTYGSKTPEEKTVRVYLNMF